MRGVKEPARGDVVTGPRTDLMVEGSPRPVRGGKGLRQGNGKGGG